LYNFYDVLNNKQITYMQSINQSVNYFTASEMTYIVSSGALNSTHYHYIAPKS